MALNCPSEPTLLGIPRELREKVLEKLFEGKRIYIDDGLINPYGGFPVSILKTCHLLHDEAKKAMRARFKIRGLRYGNELPPERNHKPGNDPQHEEAVRKQVQFLIQHGDCFDTVSTCAMEDGSGVRRRFSLHWFPNLKVFEVWQDWDGLEATEEECLDDEGAIDKDGVLKVFRKWYRNARGALSALHPEAVRLIKKHEGGNRRFEVHVHLHLTLEGKSEWLSDYSEWSVVINVDKAEVWSVREELRW